MASRNPKLPNLIHWSTALAHQWHLLRISRRKDFLIFAAFAFAVLLIAGANAKIPVLHGQSADGGGTNLTLEFFSETDFGLPAAPGLIALILGYMILIFAAVGWATMVWCHENPRGRSYHWSLPIRRESHDMARVIAGGLWFLAAIVGMLFVITLGLVIGGRLSTLSIVPPAAWVNFVTGPFTMYLLTSIAAVLSSRPLRTFFLVWILLIGPWLLFGVMDFGPGFWLFEQINGGPFGYQTAISWGLIAGFKTASVEGFPFKWLASAALWMVLGAGGIMAATRRHMEP